MGDTRIQNLRESVKRILGLIKKGDYISVNQFSGETYTEVSLTDDSSKYKNEFEIDNYSIQELGTVIIKEKFRLWKPISTLQSIHCVMEKSLFAGG